MHKLTAGLLLLGLTSCGLMRHGQEASTPGYVVFFAEKSAVLEASDTAIIARAAAQARAMPDAPVAVIGWTDSAGSPQADVTLSQLRAQRVADALAADGVTPSRVARQGRGQTHNDPGVESRRVEIRVGD